MNLLQVAGLSKSYGRLPALVDVSFDVREGEIVALLGPNGAGKSTLFKCLAGVVSPDSMSMSTGAGRPQTGHGMPVAYLPEFPELYGALTVQEHLRFVALLQGTPDAESTGRSLCHRFGLDGASELLPHELSQGMKRKLAIVMALMAGASLLLLDEPFNGLDPQAARELRQVIADVARSGGGVLVSTHRLVEAESFADKALILSAGCVVAQGSFAELRERAAAHPEDDLEAVFLLLTGEVRRE